MAVALSLAAAALVAFAPANGARADDEDDEATFEQKIIRGLLGGNSKGPIEYRERSPLVIPPSEALPPPEASSVTNNPAWPQDPDRRKARTSTQRRTISAEEGERAGARNLRPDELRRGTVAARRDDRPANTQSDAEAGRPMRPSEYGDGKTIMNFFNSNKSADAQGGVFTGEPTRQRMTEPPSGYRTPSTPETYREPKESAGSWFRALNPFDRATNY